MAEKCKECGCKCSNCVQDNEEHSDMHLHVEIEHLRQRLLERDNHIVTMETHFLSEADKFPNGELASIKEEILIWQEKYSRLFEAHKRVQKVNQNLEDKLLKIVDKCETEKGAFTKDIATLSHRLADANFTIHRLTQDNEKYRNDVNLAIQLLQCKPSNFIGQKYDSLPPEVQAKVRTYIAQKGRTSESAPADVKSITVPISTFPPTAMVYNITKPSVEKHSDDDTDDTQPPVDMVSAAIMAKVLEDREKERIFAKHCDTCTCHRSILMVDAETQTVRISDTPFYEDSNLTTTQNAGRYPEVYKNVENTLQGKHSQNPAMTENTTHNGRQPHDNSTCTMYSNGQPSFVKDMPVSKKDKNLDGFKDSQTSNSVKISLSKKPNQIIYQNQNERTTNLAYFPNVNDTSSIRLNMEKIKSCRINSNLDPQSDVQPSTNCWNSTENKQSCKVSTNLDNSFAKNEQTQIDIINERLWKNEWTKVKSEANINSIRNQRRFTTDIEIDVINDREWRHDKFELETQNPSLTLIEVKNIDISTNQNENRQSEVTTSPSFSSDSIVISTSDPPSSSSDVVQPAGDGQSAFNSTNSKIHRQTRILGPRNCLVRVTPGSNNILLDNAGHYKTVLYTSNSNKPNTALVHAKKMPRSGSIRSTSTSSEENSPVLMQDNNQLQRVAEWVQSSARLDDPAKNDNNRAMKTGENAINKWQSSAFISVDESKRKLFDYDKQRHYGICEKAAGDLRKSTAVSESEKPRGVVNTISVPLSNNSATQEKEKDLITFDWPDEAKKPEIVISKQNSNDINYEVKITKEMEETYLKLAASLDPVALNLPTTDGADLTIQKYRKDHKMASHAKSWR